MFSWCFWRRAIGRGPVRRMFHSQTPPGPMFTGTEVSFKVKGSLLATGFLLGVHEHETLVFNSYKIFALN